MADTQRPTNPADPSLIQVIYEATAWAGVSYNVVLRSAEAAEAWLGERLAAAEAKAVEAERERYAPLVEAVRAMPFTDYPSIRHWTEARLCVLAALADLGEGQQRRPAIRNDDASRGGQYA